MTAPPLPQPGFHCSPHQHSGTDSGAMMRLVIYFCLPAVAVSTWFFGIGILLNLLLAVLVTLALEAATLALRRRSWRTLLRDPSALVSAVLLGCVLPQGIAWWLVVTATFVANAVARNCYGGLGQNLFNPALCGYALLLLLFPSQTANWQIPLTDSSGNGISPLSMAGLAGSLNFMLDTASTTGLNTVTPLLAQHQLGNDSLSALLAGGTDWVRLLSPGGKAGQELIGVAYLAGGMLLLVRRVIGWQVPLGVLATLIAASLTLAPVEGLAPFTSVSLHLAGTGVFLAAFFLATDPVTSPTTPWSKFFYGSIIGAAIYSLQTLGNSPGAITFAVLLGNLLTPLIDKIAITGACGNKGTGLP
ncbi:MAG: RnfABCDGE type electron transport complex subunit D [Gammaproteobacteria bacterium]|nr:RnfABCDGE type electron transport complex subunit D [Pseudomonadales bacterium]